MKTYCQLTGLALVTCVSLTGCATASSQTDSSAEPALLSKEPSHDVTSGDLSAALAGSWRPASERARDVYRHPLETLAFFDVTARSTVIEVWPGGGWYTAVLAPYLQAEGKLVTAAYPPSAPGIQGKIGSRFAKRLDAHPEVYAQVERAFLLEETGHLNVGENVADVIVNLRNTHNMVRFGKGPSAYFQAMARALKPGGVLGIVQHRAPEHHAEGETGKHGYLKESFIIRLAQDAGLVLEAESEINANPKDTADYKGGVWTLPPGLQGGEQDRARYVEIGESDRMTFRFIKPVNADAAVTTFWVGTSQVSSPDGQTPYGPPSVAMAMRTVRNDDGVITETILDQGRLQTVLLSRQPQSAIFKVRETASFSGQLDFTGHETALDGWTYTIQMSDGSGSLSGAGRIEQEQRLLTEKTFTDPTGTAQVRITERFEKVDADTFWAQLKTQTATPPSSLEQP